MPTLSTEHSYLAARQDWQERYGSLIAQARNWRLIAMLEAAAIILALSIAIFFAVRNPFQPVIIPIDSFGRTVGGGVSQPLTKEQEDSTRNALIHAFVYDMRTVSSDQVAQKQAIDRVYARIKKGSAANVSLNDHYRADSPFERAKTQTVNVQLNSILRTSAHTYEASWTETTRETSSGELTGRSKWRAVFTVVESKPQTEAAAWLNPMGVFVTNLNIAKVQDEQ